MRSIVTALFTLAALACGVPHEADFRDGGSSSGGGDCEPPPAPPIGSATETWPCLCENSDECKPGLQCVPLPGTKEMRCLAPMFGEAPGGGGYITNCKYQNEERAAFYPWGVGLSPPYCSACLGCEPPPDGSLICQ